MSTVDTLSVAHLGRLRSAPLGVEPQRDNLTRAHLGWLALFDESDDAVLVHVHAMQLDSASAEVAEVASSHVHAMQLDSASAEVADLVSAHAHLVALESSEVSK